MRAVLFAAGIGLALTLSGAGVASTGSDSIDPTQRAVPGSCSASYLDIFRTARDVSFEGDYARMVVQVAVQRDPQTGRVIAAEPAIQEASDNLTPQTRAALVAAMRRAYLRPEPDDCRGVVSARPIWVLRFGDVPAIAAPDDPIMINRATAATRLRQRSGIVELVDPGTARTRLTPVPSALANGARCYTSDLWRDFGPLPPVQKMARGARYRVQFMIDERGRTDRVRAFAETAGTPEADADLMGALETYVRASRFYPPVSEECAPLKSAGVLFVGRD